MDISRRKQIQFSYYIFCADQIYTSQIIIAHVKFNLTPYMLLFCVKCGFECKLSKRGVPHKSCCRWAFLAGPFLLSLSLVPPHVGPLPVIFGMQKLPFSFAFSIKHSGTDKRSTYSSELGAYVNVGSSYPFLEFFHPDSKCLPWGTYSDFILIREHHLYSSVFVKS